MTTNDADKKIPLMSDHAPRLSSEQQEILRRWQKKNRLRVSQEVKDTLKIKFDGEVLFDEPMAAHTHIKIGGKADVFLKPKSKEALLFAIKLANDNGIPYHFHGGGSNTLVRDGGIRGFVICVIETLDDITIVERCESHIDILASAGARFSRLIKLCQEEGIADIMSLTGIPGSVGGLVKMNAGIPSREIKDVVRNITIITKEGEQQTLSREHLDFEYRSLKLPRTHFILSVLFRFRDLSSPEDALAIMRQHQEARVSKQPLEFPSLGSVFKNPQPLHRKDIATPAGKLIEEAGLKNIRIGGARISPKHANFIINENEAKASDVLSLISLIKDKVKQISQIELETEIRILGEEACC